MFARSSRSGSFNGFGGGCAADAEGRFDVEGGAVEIGGLSDGDGFGDFDIGAVNDGDSDNGNGLGNFESGEVADEAFDDGGGGMEFGGQRNRLIR